MKAVIQRVSSAQITADGEYRGKTGQGLCVLLGVDKNDEKEDAEKLCEKIVKLRIFKDENDKMNLSLNDIGGDMAIVSNFTLLANYSHGNRPEYFEAAASEKADELYEYFVSLAEQKVENVITGIFGAAMEINLCCDGPVTITMDSEVLKKKKS